MDSTGSRFYVVVRDQLSSTLGPTKYCAHPLRMNTAGGAVGCSYDGSYDGEGSLYICYGPSVGPRWHVEARRKEGSRLKATSVALWQLCGVLSVVLCVN